MLKPNNLGIGAIFHAELEKQLLTKPLQSFWVCNNFAGQNYFKKPLSPILFQRFSQINVQSLIAWISCTNMEHHTSAMKKKIMNFTPPHPHHAPPQKKEIRRVTVPKNGAWFLGCKHENAERTPGGDSSLRGEIERTSTTEASGRLPTLQEWNEWDMIKTYTLYMLCCDIIIVIID